MEVADDGNTIVLGSPDGEGAVVDVRTARLTAKKLALAHRCAAASNPQPTAFTQMDMLCRVGTACALAAGGFGGTLSLWAADDCVVQPRPAGRSTP
jgi:hypothetical protein